MLDHFRRCWTLAFRLGNHDALLAGITEIAPSHANPALRCYEMTESERLANRLYRPEQVPSGRRELQSRYPILRLRRHETWCQRNDIVPLTGDIVRWRLQVPSRNADAPVAGQV